jgi:hypothetical protein
MIQRAAPFIAAASTATRIWRRNARCSRSSIIPDRVEDEERTAVSLGIAKTPCVLCYVRQGRRTD